VEKKRSKGERVGVLRFVCPERSKGEEAWGEKVEGIINRVKYVFGKY
jgi:hypothetical protein